ncbi:homoserine O-acetyltransferase [Nocardioides luteus]|uniref:Homoserine O-succinyltransferase n=1 Tax=Nocardioides luteus TaxID=1844 RepID=A0ABQ5SUR1_9ACTN|nr:homoserine O-acetyltransferase [Nocardioides luteus]MDR7309527.1 homoserine O-acetyltransferase [Nocardioides luteus]GGR51852.1 homoserine O-acetyltransferase [Nocardioides luteus]GLJ67933.1 homoserine O-acetyltransferase [Nocardioides luteus]
MTAVRHARLFDEADPLRLSGGGTLAPVDVAYTTCGDLSPARDNAVFIAHALTGDAEATEWWPTMVGPGRPVDTDRFFVVCANLLGGCRGTTGPSSTDPATGRAWGLDFPLISVADLVTVHRRLIAHLGIERLYAAVGGSLGGMQVLQWAADAPGQAERAVLVAASARLSAQNIALSTIARQAILRDPAFHGGRYPDHGVVPADGLSVARMLGHVTYVSEPGLEAKFGRDRRGAPGFGIDFEIESYLDHQARSFVDRFDALSYLYLSRLLDYFDPFTSEEFAERIRDTRFQVISFDSDWRFSTSHSVLIEKELRRVGLDVERHEIASSWGHDSFLLDPPGYLDLVRTFLNDRTGAGS